MTNPTIEVAAWADLDDLPATMDQLGQQLDELVRHARTWVCNRDGFEPSPSCLLRPMAEAMGLIEAAFTEVGQTLGEQWERLRDGVVVAAADLRDADALVAANLPEVA